ncbi:MAG: DUF6361 family protein [candidate division WOR-3 bacterium]|nr:DUF6361 family protein [candidate division WOR-3 bacterium]
MLSSAFTWLDYSEKHRRQMLDAINLLGERDTRDELGVGTIRDAISDLLVPGINTIQTRARYFLFIPWIYQRLERKRVRSADFARKARDCEADLVEALLESGESEGVLGRIAKRSLKRLPSNIYWLGLGMWGIRLFQGGQDQYYRWIDHFYRRLDADEQGDAEEPETGTRSRNWHAALPRRPDDFPDGASFKLSAEEATYLSERIIERVPETLLAFLAREGKPTDRGDFPWQHPQFGEFPDHIVGQLAHARRFSESMHGAVLLYNLMLAEKAKADGLRADLRGRLKEWAGVMSARAASFAGWNMAGFWNTVAKANPRVPLLTRRFVEAWLNFALNPKVAARVSADGAARDLIANRERFLKRGLARLDNQRALEDWLSGGGEAGTDQMAFRWDQTQTITSDILKGRKRQPHA